MEREYAYAMVRTEAREAEERPEYAESPNNVYYGHISTRDRDALALKTAGAIWTEG